MLPQPSHATGTQRSEAASRTPAQPPAARTTRPADPLGRVRQGPHRLNRTREKGASFTGESCNSPSGLTAFLLPAILFLCPNHAQATTQRRAGAWATTDLPSQCRRAPSYGGSPAFAVQVDSSC